MAAVLDDLDAVLDAHLTLVSKAERRLFSDVEVCDMLLDLKAILTSQN